MTELEREMGVSDSTHQGNSLESVVKTCTHLVQYLKEVSERERERGRIVLILINTPLGSEAAKRRKNTTRATTSHHRRTAGTHGYHGNGKPHPLTRLIQENPITCRTYCN